MNVSVCIGTYGDEEWKRLAESRAGPSTLEQGVYEVVFWHDPDGTIASVRNELGRDAKGDWLCFLDADDELDRGYIWSMQRAYERRRRTDGVPPLLTPAVSYVRKGRRQTPRFLSGDLRNNNYLVVGTLIRKDLFMEVGGFSDYPHGFEDWSLWAKAWKAGAKIIQVRRAVYIAYVDENSKHRQMWRDRAYQAEWHERVQKELFPV